MLMREKSPHSGNILGNQKYMFIFIKLFVYFITLQLFQRDMYNVTLSQTLQKINNKGSEFEIFYIIYKNH